MKTVRLSQIGHLPITGPASAYLATLRARPTTLEIMLSPHNSLPDANGWSTQDPGSQGLPMLFANEKEAPKAGPGSSAEL